MWSTWAAGCRHPGCWQMGLAASLALRSCWDLVSSGGRVLPCQGGRQGQGLLRPWGLGLWQWLQMLGAACGMVVCPGVSLWCCFDGLCVVDGECVSGAGFLVADR